MKKAIVIFYICFSCFVLPVNSSEPANKKVLIVASNLIDMGDAKKHDTRNNLLEYAPPYHIFVIHGYDVDFVSPSGGKVHFSKEPMGISSYTIKYEGFLDKANSSLKPKQVNPDHYSAVFIGGGYGTLFDVASNQEILDIIARIYENSGVVGGCGHGPGGFANVKMSNGQFMVKGKRVAGFPNSTEKFKGWARQGSLLPFMVEDQLKKNGAITVNKKSISDKHLVIVDQRIVSTMFLPSAALVAKEMVDLL